MKDAMTCGHNCPAFPAGFFYVKYPEISTKYILSEPVFLKPYGHEDEAKGYMRKLMCLPLRKGDVQVKLLIGLASVKDALLPVYVAARHFHVRVFLCLATWTDMSVNSNYIRFSEPVCLKLVSHEDQAKGCIGKRMRLPLRKGDATYKRISAYISRYTLIPGISGRVFFI